jgi:hypothetical protein
VRHGSAGGSDVFAGGDASQRCPEDQFCRGQQCGGLRAGRPFVGDGQSSCVSRSKRNGPMSGLWAASRCAAVARFGPHSAAKIGGENISTEMALPISTARSRSPVALASASSAPKTGSTPGSTTRWADARTGRPAGRRGVARTGGMAQAVTGQNGVAGPVVCRPATGRVTTLCQTGTSSDSSGRSRARSPADRIGSATIGPTPGLMSRPRPMASSGPTMSL